MKAAIANWSGSKPRLLLDPMLQLCRDFAKSRKDIAIHKLDAFKMQRQGLIGSGIHE